MHEMNTMLLRTTLLYLLATACVPDFGSGNRGLTILGVASSTIAACQFDDGLPPVIGDAIVLDLASSESLRLPLVVRNDWDDPVALKNMDFRFECDVIGFSGPVGPIFVPTFSINQPFCLDTRDESTDFVGFDVIALSGVPLSPGETGVIWAEIIPSHLGRGLEAMADLALLAVPCRDADHVDDCRPFEEAYAEVGGLTNIGDAAQRYAAYAPMDGSYRLEEQVDPPTLSSGVRMQVRGLLRGEDNRHDGIFSNELIHIVEICRNCGEVVPGTPPTRAPRTGFECYYDPSVPR
jgi:hypothetical protein